jgi:hypothetical protein
MQELAGCGFAFADDAPNLVVINFEHIAQQNGCGFRWADAA